MDEVRITLRLPKDLWVDLADQAEDDHRSLNAEIVVLLEQAMKRRKPARKEPGI